MLIRFAAPEDIALLTEYDKHITKQELENSIRLNRVFIAKENNQLAGWLRYNLFWTIRRL